MTDKQLINFLIQIADKKELATQGITPTDMLKIEADLVDKLNELELYKNAITELFSSEDWECNYVAIDTDQGYLCIDGTWHFKTSPSICKLALKMENEKHDK